MELPSQFMENWFYHRPVARALSRHVHTGAALDDDAFGRLAAMRAFLAGYGTLRQLSFAALDMALHEGAPAGLSAEQLGAWALEQRRKMQDRWAAPTHAHPLQCPSHTSAPVHAPRAAPVTPPPLIPPPVAHRLPPPACRRYAVLEPLPEDQFLCSFRHIFAGGYAAGYYSYKARGSSGRVGLVGGGASRRDLRAAHPLGARAVGGAHVGGCIRGLRGGRAGGPRGRCESHPSDFVPHPPTPPARRPVRRVGRRFRDTVLAKGGSESAADVFREFRGRDVDGAALLRHSGLA